MNNGSIEFARVGLRGATGPTISVSTPGDSLLVIPLFAGIMGVTYAFADDAMTQLVAPLIVTIVNLSPARCGKRVWLLTPTGFKSAWVPGGQTLKKTLPSHLSMVANMIISDVRGFPFVHSFVRRWGAVLCIALLTISNADTSNSTADNGGLPAAVSTMWVPLALASVRITTSAIFAISSAATTDHYHHLVGRAWHPVCSISTLLIDLAVCTFSIIELRAHAYTNASGEAEADPDRPHYWGLVTMLSLGGLCVYLFETGQESYASWAVHVFSDHDSNEKPHSASPKHQVRRLVASIKPPPPRNTKSASSASMQNPHVTSPALPVIESKSTEEERARGSRKEEGDQGGGTNEDNNEQPLQQGIKILVLDGGGVRGATLLMLLERLMAQLDNKTPLGEQYDLICGTSAGGLLVTTLSTSVASDSDSLFSIIRGVHNVFMDKCFKKQSKLCLLRKGYAVDNKVWAAMVSSTKSTKQYDEAT